MIEDDQRDWCQNLPKNKFRIMVQMLKSDSLTNSDIFEKVAMNDSTWDNNKVYMIVDDSLVLSVHGSITDGMF